MDTFVKRSGLQSQMCFIHAERPAAARCPSCQKHFCRECVVEHEGRMLCQSCIEATIETEEKKDRTVIKSLAGFASASISIALLWVAFYLLGHMLSSIPADFHRSPAEYYKESTSGDEQP